jgi:hypothetical protein
MPRTTRWHPDRGNGEGAFPALIHCFTASADFGRAVLDLGLTISISGIVTFKNAKDLQAFVKTIPKTGCWWRPTRRSWRRSRIAARMRTGLRGRYGRLRGGLARGKP